MSLFTVTVGVGNPSGGELIEVSATVDTDEGYAMLPESLLTQLQIRPAVERTIEFADGRVEKRAIGEASIAYNGIAWVCPVIFGPEGQYLLGRITLAICSLEADPANRRLVPATFYARPI